jgi:uncharacterized protein (DUF1501 family)
MQRRHLIAATAALCAGARAWAAPGDARFLLVFLRGGYDALTLLAPAGNFYRQARPTLAVPWNGDGARPLDADWALHPRVHEALGPLLQAREISFVPFAGTHDSSRSHFETQDTIELGQDPSGTRDLGSGFMNRLAAQLGAGSALAFTPQLPLALRGTLPVANLPLQAARAQSANPQEAALAAMYRGTPLAERVDEGFALRRALTAQQEADRLQAMEPAARQAAGAASFEAQARRMARLMRERTRLSFVDVGGWDTHANQGGLEGVLPTRLQALARGLAAFADELGASTWRRTRVVVVSEFGRTVRENGNRGTDHGHGSVYWVLGGGLAAPPVLGEQLRVEAGSLFEQRDLPVKNEVRALLGGLLQRQFGLSAAALQQVFPGAQPLDLGLA